MEDPNEYARDVAEWRKWAYELSAALEKGEPIDRLDAPIVAAILRNWADLLKDKQKLKPGEKRSVLPKLDPILTWVRYADYRDSGKGKTHARNLIADYFDCSEPAVAKSIKQTRTEKPWWYWLKQDPDIKKTN